MLWPVPVLFSSMPPATRPSSTLSLHDALPISVLNAVLKTSYSEALLLAALRIISRGEARLRRCRYRERNRSEEHTSELQSLRHLVCRLLLEKKKYRALGNHGRRAERLWAIRRP